MSQQDSVSALKGRWQAGVSTGLEGKGGHLSVGCSRGSIVRSWPSAWDPAMVPQGKGRSMWTKEMGIYPYSTPAKELAGWGPEVGKDLAGHVGPLYTGDRTILDILELENAVWLVNTGSKQSCGTLS